MGVFTTNIYHRPPGSPYARYVWSRGTVASLKAYTEVSKSHILISLFVYGSFKNICTELRPISHTLGIAGFCKELKGKSNIARKIFVWLLPYFP